MGTSGNIIVRSGGVTANDAGGAGGSISLMVGIGKKAGGGRVAVVAGEATKAASRGGSVSLVSGHGRVKSSGAFSIRTANAGTGGTSGPMVVSSSTSSKGHSGAITRVKISPDGEKIVTVGAEGAIFIWQNVPISEAV